MVEIFVKAGFSSRFCVAFSPKIMAIFRSQFQPFLVFFQRLRGFAADCVKSIGTGEIAQDERKCFLGSFIPLEKIVRCRGLYGPAMRHSVLVIFGMTGAAV